MIRSGLKNLAEAYVRVRGHPDGFVYSSLEDLILREGTVFPQYHKKLPPGVERGTPRLCFQNAFKLAFSSDSYTYCEGFALLNDLWPMHHAWVIDDKGIVIDNTWDTSKKIEYMGLAFELDYVQRKIFSKGTYAIMDNFESGYPELREGWDGLKNVKKVDRLSR